MTAAGRLAEQLEELRARAIRCVQELSDAGNPEARRIARTLGLPVRPLPRRAPVVPSDLDAAIERAYERELEHATRTPEDAWTDAMRAAVARRKARE